MQPDPALAAGGGADFHHGEIVMVAEREEGHFRAALVEACGDRQAEHPVIEVFGARAVRHPQHHVPQGLDFHGSRSSSGSPKPTIAPWRLRANSSAAGRLQRPGQRLLHVAQPVLAEVELVAHDEGGASKGAGGYRGLGVGDQRLLDLGVFRTGHERDRVQARRRQRLSDHRRIVHLQPLFPHRGEHRLDVGREHPLALGGHRAAHDLQRIDREVRVHPVGGQAMAGHEPLGLARLVGQLVLHTGEGLGGRSVVGQLEDAAQEDRDVVEARAGALFDRRDHPMREIGVGAAEIEIEDHLRHQAHQVSEKGRMSSSWVQASRGWACSRQ